MKKPSKTKTCKPREVPAGASYKGGNKKTK